MKLFKIKFDVNFFKVTLGVIFSLIWGRTMYLIWPQPSYIIFLLFYLLAGSVLLKWVFFEIIDRIYLRVRLKSVVKEIDESGTRVRKVVEASSPEEKLLANSDNIGTIEDFSKKLNLLEQEIPSFGNMVKIAMTLAVLSLKEKDTALATKVIERDSEIDRKRYILESECMQLIRTNRANDSDLRKIVAMLDIVPELERMGDYAEGVAKITLMIGKDPHLAPPAELYDMANKAVEMLEGSLESFRDNDVEKAKLISTHDDQVDRLYDHAFRHLVMFMIEHPRDITKVTWLLWAAHNLERFADRVTNICERVVFSASGEISEVKVSKY